MKKFSLSWVLLSAFLLVAVGSCQTTKSGTASKMLKFGFEKGKGYDYEMIINTDQQVEGQTIPLDMTSYYSMDVTEDDGDTKTIATTFERFKTSTSIMGFNLEIDTDKPLPDLGMSEVKDALKMVNGLLGAVKGRKFSMRVNSEGKVTEVFGFKEMATAIADSFHLSEKDRTQMITVFNEQFSDDKVKSQFERFLYIFPNKEVKVGDSWQKTSSGAGPMPGAYNSTYAVKEIEGDMVTLEEKTKISSNKADLKVEGEIEGELVVDSKTGLVVNADQDMSMTTTHEGKTVVMKGKTKVKGKAR